MNRRRWIRNLGAGLLAQYLNSLHAAWAAGKNPLPPGIHRLSGDVRLNGETAREGMQVKPGDSIATGKDSEVIYIIGQDAFLQREQSLVSIGGDALKNVLRLVSGKLMSVFSKGEKQIQTGTATIGIRGTGCYLETGPERDYFCLCYGKAEIASARHPEKSELIETRHHDHPVYIYPNGEKMMVPATVINHSDSELILLESLLGRVPPFYGYGSSYDKAEKN